VYLALAIHRAVVARDDDVGEVEAMQKGRSPRPAPKLMSERRLLSDGYTLDGLGLGRTMALGQ